MGVIEDHIGAFYNFQQKSSMTLHQWKHKSIIYITEKGPCKSILLNTNSHNLRELSVELMMKKNIIALNVRTILLKNKIKKNQWNIKFQFQTTEVNVVFKSIFLAQINAIFGF